MLWLRGPDGKALLEELGNAALANEFRCPISHRRGGISLPSLNFSRSSSAQTSPDDLRYRPLWMSNAGGPQHPGRVPSKNRPERAGEGLATQLRWRISTSPHHFRPEARKGADKGGLLLVGANGLGKMALSLIWRTTAPAKKRLFTASAKRLHIEFRPLGIYVDCAGPGIHRNTRGSQNSALTTDTMPHGSR